MTTARFDPEAGRDYGTCRACDLALADEAAGKEHMKQTLTDRRSHSIRVLNPSRRARIANRIDLDLEDVVDQGLQEVARLVTDGHITAEEATEALASWPDFHDAWNDNIDQYLED